ncbi:metallophosphoesterase [Gemella sp. GH3]|uniref:metallophosphoesterase family protein n=1 Tax=unclassified Gemella TaxID=2624949 RepID=UPI0015D061B8|nr:MULTISPECIES: metallophosphoesterase [unclassified Gemella]MBF0713509.1 metallophosphoesterase [Gemella sp. GH3.1]NYS50461.1 metallophosphoesterase [Gemella sp. GH3]
MIKGRNCSLKYMLQEKWAENIDILSDKPIYIIGGLYGNYQSLMKIKELANEEKENPLLIFNGDIHWFDVYEEDFLAIENDIESCIKLFGNVEYELLNKDSLFGCGCNYPENVDESIVERSNNIHSMLKDNITDEGILRNLKNRKFTICLKYLDKKIAITHGDEKNMAGWQCSNENLKKFDRQKEIEHWLEDNNVDILATTHTCLPVLLSLGNKVVVNNGSAGMANVRDTTFGLITRIANTKHKDAIISQEVDGVFVELVKIDYDITEFINWFDNVWTINSPASISYRNRITNGTNISIEDIVITK